MKEITVKKDVVDKQGMTISKDIVVYVEAELHNPITNKDELVILIENGTGIFDLMPKTIIEKEKLE